MGSVYLRFAENVQRAHLCTEVPAAYWMLELFEEVGDIPENFSLGKDVAKNDAVKIVLKTYSWSFFLISNHEFAFVDTISALMYHVLSVSVTEFKTVCLFCRICNILLILQL